MDNIFFVDDEHRMNFEHMKQTFPIACKNLEYQSACYISALPMLFYKFKDELQDYDTPIDWMFNWQMKYEEQDETESDEEYHKRTNVKMDFDLTPSMQHLGKLALNLFNGYNYFNLMDCLALLDDDGVRVLKSAIDIRLGVSKQ